MRGCACRGTAGFAHVSCLAEQTKILLHYRLRATYECRKPCSAPARRHRAISTKMAGRRLKIQELLLVRIHIYPLTTCDTTTTLETPNDAVDETQQTRRPAASQSCPAPLRPGSRRGTDRSRRTAPPTPVPKRRTTCRPGARHRWAACPPRPK